jgi:hypothetical protein
MAIIASAIKIKYFTSYFCTIPTLNAFPTLQTPAIAVGKAAFRPLFQKFLTKAFFKTSAKCVWKSLISICIVDYPYFVNII